MKVPDLVGKKFNSLTVIKMLEKNRHGEMTWLCRCDCGNERIATSNKLTHGYTVSCQSCRYKKMASKNYKHGMAPLRLWNTYYSMLERCYNEKSAMYYRYGKRGIIVCDEWKESFVVFRKWALANGYNEHLTIDRIDNDGNYTPDNCKWSTPREQSNNRSTNRFITYNGVTDTVANWARRMGMKYGMLSSRLRLGWPDEKLFIPATRKARNNDRCGQQGKKE